MQFLGLLLSSIAAAFDPSITITSASLVALTAIFLAALATIPFSMAHPLILLQAPPSTFIAVIMAFSLVSLAQILLNFQLSQQPFGPFWLLLIELSQVSLAVLLMVLPEFHQGMK